MFRTEIDDDYINDIREALEAMADAIRNEQKGESRK